MIFRLLSVPAFLVLASCASVVAPILKADVKQEAAALRAGEYELDTDHAALIFHVDHLGFSKFVGRFERFDATLDFSADDPEAAKIEAVIDMTSLDVANDDFSATLMGSGWFEAQTYPEARFVSEAITVTGDNQGTMTGILTMHGESQPVTLEVVFNGGGRDRLRGAYVTGFSAHGKFSRAAFGVDRFAAYVGDEVTIEIQAEFLKR